MIAIRYQLPVHSSHDCFAQGKAFTEEEDRFLLCKMSEIGFVPNILIVARVMARFCARNGFTGNVAVTF